MDKYRVGQKVRLIKSERFPQDVGRVFFIVEPRYWRLDPVYNEEYFGYLLEDGTGCQEHKLAPVYDGDGKSSWEECLWKPVKDNVPLST